MARVCRTEHQRGEPSPEVLSCILRSAAQHMSVREVPDSGERASWKDVKEQGLELTQGGETQATGVSLSTQNSSLHRRQN